MILYASTREKNGASWMENRVMEKNVINMENVQIVKWVVRRRIMRNKLKRVVLVFLMIVATMYILTGCTEVNQVSHNVSKEADNFNVIRRLTVLNTRTHKPMFELVAAFSLVVDIGENQLEIICETGMNEYKKHFIGLNDETVYVVEDISGANVNKYRYEVNFLPEMIIPITVTQKD